MTTFDEISSEVRDRHGVVLTGGRRADLGESGDGAWFALDGDGTPVVVKWHDEGAASRIEVLRGALDVARARGVPVPRYRPPLVIPGRCVSVQELLAGDAEHDVSPAVVDDVHQVLRALRGIDAPHHLGERWGETIARSLRVGLEGWCEHGSMLEHSDRTRALVAHARSIDLSPAAVPDDDLVHNDLHPGNLLQRDGRLAGIVDWESACAGDGRFDLVYFAFCLDARQPRSALTGALWAEAEATTPPFLLRAYAAHMALRMVDWMIRHHDEATVQRWLGPAEALVARYP